MVLWEVDIFFFKSEDYCTYIETATRISFMNKVKFDYWDTKCNYSDTDLQALCSYEKPLISTTLIICRAASLRRNVGWLSLHKTVRNFQSLWNDFLLVAPKCISTYSITFWFASPSHVSLSLSESRCIRSTTCHHILQYMFFPPKNSINFTINSLFWFILVYCP